MLAFLPATLLARVLTLVGPLLLKLRPLAARLPALPQAGTLAIVGAFAVVAWFGHGAVADWRDQRQRAGIRASAVAETTSALELATLRATGSALAKAFADNERTHMQRATDLAAQSESLAHFEDQQRSARDASPDPDTILIPAGDPWLVRHRPFADRAGGVRQDGAAADPLRRTSGR